jgi:hypothetical protein
VLGSHGARNLTGIGQLADGVLALQQHLNHPQSVRVSQRAQAFRRVVQRIQPGQPQF